MLRVIQVSFPDYYTSYRDSSIIQENSSPDTISVQKSYYFFDRNSSGMNVPALVTENGRAISMDTVYNLRIYLADLRSCIPELEVTSIEPPYLEFDTWISEIAPMFQDELRVLSEEIKSAESYVSDIHDLLILTDQDYNSLIEPNIILN